MDRIRGQTWERREIQARLWPEGLKARQRLEDLSSEEKPILKWILKQ
jgi:hypothetical protein